MLAGQRENRQSLKHSILRHLKRIRGKAMS